MINSRLRKTLLSLLAQDQHELRRGNLDERAKSRSSRLRAIIAKYGWPSDSLVGKDGEEAAWLLAQHSDADVRFQEQCLRLLKQAVKNGGAPKWQVAYLADRVRVHRKGTQLFGTQFYEDGTGAFRPRPIVAASKLSIRRRRYDLPPFRQYQRFMLSKTFSRRDGSRG